MGKPLTQRGRRWAPGCALGLAGLAMAWAPASAGADEIDAGRAKAQACAVCHGPLGVSSQPDTPHLAGQPASYLVQQLRAFRSGSRRHEVMAVIAKPLSDDDIGKLAAWYSSVKVEATAPR
jgi:cytochrome c553